jgi:hypothetical protein
VWCGRVWGVVGRQTYALDGRIGRSRRREAGLGGGSVRRQRNHTVLPAGCWPDPISLVWPYASMPGVFPPLGRACAYWRGVFGATVPVLERS